MRNHRGFTLVELLVVLLIMTIVTGGIYRLLNSTQRLTRAQTEKIDLQSNVRTASIVIPTELREVNTFTGAPSSIAHRHHGGHRDVHHLSGDAIVRAPLWRQHPGVAASP